MTKVWIVLYISILSFDGAFSGQWPIVQNVAKVNDVVDVINVHFKNKPDNYGSTRNIDTVNGNYSIRAGNSVLEFTCNSGFILYGESVIVCFGYSWSADPPICIAWTPPRQCDFEQGPDACVWGQGWGDDQDWVLNTGSTPTSRTGPDHDHTLGQDGDGHYMYFETSSTTRDNHSALLESPIYAFDLSNLSFSFWYHILGEKEIGTLDVIIKPDDHDGLVGLEPAFSVSQSLGSMWQNHTI